MRHAPSVGEWWGRSRGNPRAKVPHSHPTERRRSRSRWEESTSGSHFLHPFLPVRHRASAVEGSRDPWADYMISWSTTINDGRPDTGVSRFIACRRESNPERTSLALAVIPVERVTSHVRARQRPRDVEKSAGFGGERPGPPPSQCVLGSLISIFSFTCLSIYSPFR